MLLPNFATINWVKSWRNCCQIRKGKNKNKKLKTHKTPQKNKTKTKKNKTKKTKKVPKKTKKTKKKSQKKQKKTKKVPKNNQKQTNKKQNQKKKTINFFCVFLLSSLQLFTFHFVFTNSSLSFSSFFTIGSSMGKSLWVETVT
jgi:cation transport ATPase